MELFVFKQNLKSSVELKFSFLIHNSSYFLVSVTCIYSWRNEYRKRPESIIVRASANHSLGAGFKSHISYGCYPSL